ncbi:hypothetical protein Tco_0927228 [Tanacetum coccineum]
MEETLPAETEKARAIRLKSGRYDVVNDILYKKSYLGPWLRCVGPLQANYVLREIHEGSCSMHAGTRSVVAKIEEVPHVLWAHCTMIKSSNGNTPFSLTYGTKAVIPAKNGMPTFRTAEIDMLQNDEALEINLDLLEERREQAAIHEAISKANMKSTTIPKSATQASSLVTWYTETTMPATQKTAESLA